jgi:hypothetical protein
MLSRQSWRRMTKPGALVAITLFCTTAARAQQSSTSFESVIRQQNAQDVVGYIQPLADVLTADLNVGWFHTAYIPKSKFSIALELIAQGSAIGDKQKTYTAHTPTGFTPATFQTATIFGGLGTTVNHQSITGLSYRGSDGFFDAQYFPSAVPQLRIGGILGTEVVGRYFSSSLVSALNEKDFPELKLLGYGARHSISQYIPAMPLDIAVSYFYTDVEWGDMVEADATAIGAQIGKSFPVLSLYGGVQSESGKMNLKYTSTNPSQTTPVAVDLEVKNQMRFAAGAMLRLGFVQLFGDAGFGDVVTYAAGLRLGF